MRSMTLCALMVLVPAILASGAVQPAAYRVIERVPDAAILPSPADVKITGYDQVGQMVANRLLGVSEETLLGGFRRRPGSHPWIGEHVGKFLHAATLAWANTGDAQLKEKIDRVVAELIKCQKPDGYLGTYVDEERWTSWDVWVHKYDLIGLLAYYRYTSDAAALEASKKIGDLLCATFGPGKRDIVASSTHVGMAAMSVLEPMVYLYRFTGDEKYLAFCNYIVGAYDQPNGPKIVRTLLETGRVDKTANGKAYEMLSNLVGLCELYRVTGNQDLLRAAINAWEDIVANHLYITGTVSEGEHFHEPGKLPNEGNIGETCATVTWFGLNDQLLRLTGEAKYAREIERTYVNHLLAAQRPDGAQWCYFTPLHGTKPYGPGTNCCVSSGPRGVAMFPMLTGFRYRDGQADGAAVAVVRYGDLRLTLDGQAVTISAKAGPGGMEADNSAFRGQVVYTLGMERAGTFGFKSIKPAWAGEFSLSSGDATAEESDGWLRFAPRQWKNGDQVVLSFRAGPYLIEGRQSNAGSRAIGMGPFVMALDRSRNPSIPLNSTALEKVEASTLRLEPTYPPTVTAPVVVQTRQGPEKRTATFVSFIEAGATGGRYRIWLPASAERLPEPTLLSDGKESRSREGNVRGSIIDPEMGGFVVTFDNRPAEEDWYAVTLDAPITVGRIVYAHGHTFHDGGWFDASAGKPKVQVQRRKSGAWETVGTLADYPDTTATDHKGLKDGQVFEVRLAQPEQVWGVRVVGKPACGDNPKQAFSSCGGLKAFP